VRLHILSRTFFDVLQQDIQAAIILHKSNDLDTTVDLALLQERVLESYQQEMQCTDFSPMPRAIQQNDMPLPIPHAT
jgi:hypothetical protein